MAVYDNVKQYLIKEGELVTDYRKITDFIKKGNVWEGELVTTCKNTNTVITKVRLEKNIDPIKKGLWIKNTLDHSMPPIRKDAFEQKHFLRYVPGVGRSTSLKVVQEALLLLDTPKKQESKVNKQEQISFFNLFTKLVKGVKKHG